MNTSTEKKVRKSRKPVYPDYLLGALDAMIKDGENPFEMMRKMKKAMLERILEAELDHHLAHDRYEKSQDGNYRNGYGSKTVLMDDGQVEISTPRDRNGTFEPKLLPRYVSAKMRQKS